MKTYLTLDGGTTNTRIHLVRDGQVLDTIKISLGARAGIGGGEALADAIRQGIADILSRNAVKTSDVEKILASGMITSEFGLCNLPHLTAPVGIRELHDGIFETTLPAITPIPFAFIRGVRLAGGTLADTDMMRGEETELIGLCDGTEAGCLYVLPGSHSKLIETDGDGRIVRFSTMLTGEMIGALSSGTILKDAVDLSNETFDGDSLTEGYRYAAEHGVNEALFKTRILKNLLSRSSVEVYSFFLGAVLSAEIDAILRADAETVVIGGRKQIKEATVYLLSRLCEKEIRAASDADVEISTVRGAIRIYEFTDCGKKG